MRGLPLFSVIGPRCASYFLTARAACRFGPELSVCGCRAVYRSIVNNQTRRAALQGQVLLPPVKAVHASRGKVVRAEPVSALYEQGRVHHLGFMTQAIWLTAHGALEHSPPQLLLALRPAGRRSLPRDRQRPTAAETALGGYCGPPRIEAGCPGSLKLWPVSVTVSPSTASTDRSESRKLPT
jgi:hypothetical protein